jgi:hypothetical protein
MPRDDSLALPIAKRSASQGGLAKGVTHRPNATACRHFGGLRSANPPAKPDRPYSLSVHLVLFPLLAFAKALRDRRSSGNQRRLIREALGEIGVILLHDVEHGFPGKLSMVLGKEFVQISELFVVHGHRLSPKIYRNLLILRQLLTRLVTIREWCRAGIAAAGR